MMGKWHRFMGSLWHPPALTQVNLQQKGDFCIKFHIVLHVASQLKGLTCLVTTSRLTRMDCCQVESEMWGFCSKVYEMRIGLTENIRMQEKTRYANGSGSTANDLQGRWKPKHLSQSYINQFLKGTSWKKKGKKKRGAVCINKGATCRFKNFQFTFVCHDRPYYRVVFFLLDPPKCSSPFIKSHTFFSDFTTRPGTGPNFGGFSQKNHPVFH